MEEIPTIKTLETNTAIEQSPAVMIDTPLTLEQQAHLMDQNLLEIDTKMNTLDSRVSGTKDEMNAIRAKLGLEASNENPQSIESSLAEKEKLEKEKQDLIEQKEQLLFDLRREELIRQETARLLQEKINAFVAELDRLSEVERQSVVTKGMMFDGKPFISKTFGVQFNTESVNKILAFAKEKKITENNIDFAKELLAETYAEIEEKAIVAVEEKLKLSEEDGQIQQFDKLEQKNLNELPIGYEGGSYTPEDLLKHIEEQNNQIQTPLVTNEVAQSYDQSIQQN